MNTQFIAHRVNTISELKAIPSEYGVEIDLRDYGSEVVLQHDPFLGGESFENYLKEFRHKFVILNVKSEGIESRVAELISTYRVENYFFLDCSFPMIHKLSKMGESNMAVRLSEYESIETVMALQGVVKWVWIDCFTKLPFSRPINEKLKIAGYKTCLVSPELQNRPQDIPAYRQYLISEGLDFDAICTKAYNIPLWRAGE